MLLLLIPLACTSGGDGTVRQAPEDTEDTVPVEPGTVQVSHTRELRGAWVATVWNINFPSSSSTDAATQQAELVAMVDRLDEAGMNAVFFQVRPEGDALYQSDLEPWSNVLTGTQGQDPGYDPLAVLITEAHARNIEVHAWLNPYRAKAASSSQVAPHVAAEYPEHVHNYGSYKWMDPGAPVVRERLVAVCADLSKRYDIDGIHFDDYFYPYPVAGTDFPDDTTWAAYQASGGTLSRADWRRNSVNTAIQEVSAAIAAEKDHVRFGVSPFGIPAPDKPDGITGFNQYDSLYADTQKWMDEGWVDYLAPQLYWPSTQTNQAYEPLIGWWADHTSGGRYIFAGNNLAELGSASKWTVEEYKIEVALSRARADSGSQGNIWYNIGPLMEDRDSIVAAFRDDLYATPALTPALSTAAGKTVAAPKVTLEAGVATLEHQDSAPLRAWSVYRADGDAWVIDRIVPGSESTVRLAAGSWATAAVSMYGVESGGVVAEVP